MPGLTVLLISAAISLTILALSSFSSFQSFHSHAINVQEWDTMALASSNRVSKISSNFLTQLRDSLLASISSYRDGQFDSSLNQERINLVETYFSDLSLAPGSQLSSTIKFGLSPHENSSKDYQSYEAQLVHSDYLPPKLSADDETYISSLVTNDQLSQAASEADEFITDGKITVQDSLLDDLLDADSAQFVRQQSDLLGINISDSGLGLPKLANGINIVIRTNIEETI